MIRQNDGKPKLGHIFHMPMAMEALARIMEWGEKKYTPVADRGWLKYNADDTLDSLLRHIQAIKNGEHIDPETGLPHADAIIFNACMYMELISSCSPLETSHGPDSSKPTGPQYSTENLNRL